MPHRLSLTVYRARQEAVKGPSRTARHRKARSGVRLRVKGPGRILEEGVERIGEEVVELGGVFVLCEGTPEVFSSPWVVRGHQKPSVNSRVSPLPFTPLPLCPEGATTQVCELHDVALAGRVVIRPIPQARAHLCNDATNTLASNLIPRASRLSSSSRPRGQPCASSPDSRS